MTHNSKPDEIELSIQQAKQAAGGLESDEHIKHGLTCPRCRQNTMTRYDLRTAHDHYVSLSCPCGFKEEYHAPRGPQD